MRKAPIILTCLTLSLSPTTYAFDWLDSIKSFVGGGDESKTEAPSSTKSMPEEVLSNINIGDITSMLTNNLDVNTQQAEGGLASLLNYAKTNLSGNDFKQLGQSLPGLDGIMGKLPDISQLSSGEGLGGLLDSAANYSDSLKSINEVKKQFEALGLTPEMIGQFINQIQSFLNTEQGQQAKALLSKGLNALTNG